MAKSKACCKRIPVKRRHFGLSWKDPDVFCRSQWPLPGWAYQVYRLCFMVYIVIWDTLTTVEGVQSLGASCLIFLTNWSFHLLAIYGLVAALSSVYYYCQTYHGEDDSMAERDPKDAEEGIANTAFDADEAKEPRDLNANPAAASADCNGVTTSDSGHQTNSTSQPRSKSTPWFFKLTWLLFNINISIAPLITVVYWGILHDFSSDEAARDPLGFGTNLNAHAINSVLMILDLFVTAYPVRIVHSVYAIAYGIVYVIFSLIFWAAGGVNPYTGEPAIYPVLDWETIPGLTVAFMFGFMAVVVIMQALAYGGYRLRRYLAARCCCSSGSRIAQST